MQQFVRLLYWFDSLASNEPSAFKIEPDDTATSSTAATGEKRTADTPLTGTQKKMKSANRKARFYGPVSLADTHAPDARSVMPHPSMVSREWMEKCEEGKTIKMEKDDLGFDLVVLAGKIRDDMLTREHVKALELLEHAYDADNE